MSTTQNQTSYPLCWPINWPRAQARARSKFASGNTFSTRRRKTMEEARQFLSEELRRIRALRMVLSTNVELRLDGMPYSNRATPKDPGAALYFQFRHRPVTLACDKWDRVEDNIYAIAKHIEALRGQERWGVGTIEQAFRGYMAIPERSSGSDWWTILGVAINASLDQAENAYREKAKTAHPDCGGSNAAMAELNLAIAEARRQLHL